MRIAIVNDVALAVEVLRRVLSKARGHKLAWVARDGLEAVQRCSRDRPDLVLMDLLMPQMDGVEATRRIMHQCPCAVMVVTASVNRHSAMVFEALNAGALDAASTPSLDRLGRPADAEVLLGKINTISRLLGAVVRPSSGTTRHFQQPHRAIRNPLVVMGASAGGPAALARVLSLLPASFAAPVLLVQHLGSPFAPGLAEWLDTQTPLRVKVAGDGDRPTPGTVLLAKGDQHLALASAHRVGYTSSPADASYCPSIDVLFSSAGRHWQGSVIGILLTGMGRDGARGMKELFDAGHCTIAQDRATSAVYGMPRAAVELNAVTRVLPVDRIGPHLANLVAHSAN